MRNRGILNDKSKYSNEKDVYVCMEKNIIFQEEIIQKFEK